MSSVTNSNIAPSLNIVDIFRLATKLWRNPPHALLELQHRFGDNFQVGLGSKIRLFILSHPDYIKHVLQDNNRNYVKKSLFHNHLLRFILGDGLLASEGDLWIRQRRMIQPIFHHERLASLIPLITDELEKMLLRWEIYEKSGEAFDIAQEMIAITQRINDKVLFGEDAIGDVIEEARRSFTKIVRMAILTGNKIPYPKKRKFHDMEQILDQSVRNLISKRLNSSCESDDILSYLIQARDRKTGQMMSINQLRDELMNLIFAGYETTEKALTWMWYLISENPRSEVRLSAEIEEILNIRTPSFEDLPRLEYTRGVINETLRLFPAAWIMGRRSIGEDLIGGIHIPSGSFILINLFGVHRHPLFWDYPDQFEPDRFLNEPSKSRPRFAFAPFGGGPRQCVGYELAVMEMQLVLAMVTQKYSVRMVPGYPVECEPEVTLKPRYGVKVTIKSRKDF